MKQSSFDFKQNEAHLWKINLGLQTLKENELREILSAAEIKRADSFYFLRDRLGFSVSHFALRLILSKYLTKNPAQIEFSANDFGKPFIENSRINFNLSHSGEFALVAVAENFEVGTDIERIRKEINHRELSEQFFSENEKKHLRSFAETQAVKEFFRLWTRKEAFVKAKGKGLSEPLANFSVINSESAGEDVFFVETKDSDDLSRRGCDLKIADNYAAAFVSDAEIFNIIIRDFNALFQ